MITLWIIVVMLSLLIAVGGALIALRIQYWVLDRTRHEREAWQQAQESRQRTWEVRQGKHILEMERRLEEQVRDVRKDFRDWSLQVEEKQQLLKMHVDIEQELARLPHVEDIELPFSFSQHGSHHQPDHWQPPTLYRADLHGRDLSHRYLGRADLRDATLTETNFYMADLSGASLTGANLERANLIGANLSGADLRGANLSGASLLVADLHNAVLHGAILLNMQKLTAEQLLVAIYDSSTIIDSAIEVTRPDILRTWSTIPTSTNTASILKAPLANMIPPVTTHTGEAEQLALTDLPVSTSVPETDPTTVFDLEQFVSTPLPAPELEYTDETEQIIASSSNVPVTIPLPELDLEMETALENNIAKLESQEGSTEVETPPGHKIIQLPARTGKADLAATSKNKHRLRGTGNQNKRKGASHLNKISSITREEDKQTRAN